MQLQFTTLLSPDAPLWGSPLLPPRFWSKVNPAGPLPDHCPELGQCWVWMAGTAGSGYGEFSVGSRSDGTRRLVYTHRHIYATLIGPIPDGLYVLHRCDNPPCVRPGHLFDGTAADNQSDMSRKGRHGSVRHPERMARGERNGNSKLNDAKVFEIHRLTRAGMTQTAIARRFLVSRMTVRRIIRRENWRQVED